MNTNLENEFWNVSRDIRRIEFNIGTLSELATSCSMFYKELEKTKEGQQMLFKDKHYDLLLKMKHFMNNVKGNTAIRSLHDKIFKVLQFTKNAPMGYTVMFEEFIKGMTYFSSQSPSKKHPIYHRLASCGPIDEKHRSKFVQCNANNTNNNERKLVKKRVETCYIERLIFDEIYKNQTLFFPHTAAYKKHSQDDGHVNWLENEIKKDYKACFPSMSINVQVSGYVQSMPTCLEISRFKNGRLASVEKYRKQVDADKKYDYFVEGILIKSQKSEKRKIQCFEKKSKWEWPRA